ncbi:MAG: DUF2688 domain-containing protein [Bacilli bacterium]|nr:DUF2688 domain-containing protein [Bacilli bacterium]
MDTGLKETKCKRCGKIIYTLAQPIFSSNETMHKYQGICASCMSEQERFHMMLSMNNDLRNSLK